MRKAVREWGSEYAVMGKSERYRPAGRGPLGGALLVVLVAFLASCQSEQSLKQRVTAFWEARLRGDEATAYQYEIYAHNGEMTLTQYIQARSPMLTYTAYTIDNIDEQDNEAQVTVKMQSQMSVPGMPDVPLAMPMKERWVRLDDRQWYRNVPPAKPGQAARQQG